MRRAEETHHRPARRAQHPHAEAHPAAQDPERVDTITVDEGDRPHHDQPQHEGQHDRAAGADLVLETAGREGPGDRGAGQDDDEQGELLLAEAEELRRDRAGEPDDDLHAGEVEGHDAQVAEELLVPADRPIGAGEAGEAHRKHVLPRRHRFPLLALAKQHEGGQRRRQEEKARPEADQAVARRPRPPVGDHRGPRQAAEPPRVAEGEPEGGDLPHVVVVGELGQERGHEVLADRVEDVAHDEERHPGGDLARRDQAQGGGHDHRDHVGHEEQPLLGPREIRQGPDQRRDHRHQGQGDDA